MISLSDVVNLNLFVKDFADKISGVGYIRIKYQLLPLLTTQWLTAKQLLSILNDYYFWVVETDAWSFLPRTGSRLLLAPSAAEAAKVKAHA